jgi:hypothetical protein
MYHPQRVAQQQHSRMGVSRLGKLLVKWECLPRTNFSHLAQTPLAGLKQFPAKVGIGQVQATLSLGF